MAIVGTPGRSALLRALSPYAPVQGAFAAFAALIFAPPVAHAQPDIRGLGVAWTSEYYLMSSFHASISPDGAAVAFTGYAERPRAYRWTQTTGSQLLPLPPATNVRKLNESWAYDISPDGTVVLGDALTAEWDFPCFWVDEAEPIAIAGGWYAYAMSADGETIVGTGDTGQPVCWLHGNAPIDLPLLPNAIGGEASAVSADGGAIAGNIHPQDGNYHPVLRRGNAGPIDLAAENHEVTGGSATAISADGRVIVGVAFPGSGRAFRWSDDTGLVVLPRLTNDTMNIAYAVSDDGDTIVGCKPYGNPRGQARIWTRSGRCRELTAYLRGIGTAGIQGWQLEKATDISADGNIVVGLGRNPLGQYEYFLARIGPLCPGDVNTDRSADLADLAVVLAHFGEPTDAVRIEGDLDDDGAIGIDDLMQVLTYFGSSCDP